MELGTASSRRQCLDKSLVVVVAIVLVTAACTSSDGSPPTTTSISTTINEVRATTPTLPETSENSTSPSLTFPAQVDPHYYTFESTLECDPDGEETDLQVVQAFFPAYNEQNLQRLEELTAPDLNEIWDPAGLPHTGQVLNTGLAAWARAGWEVNDRFELVLLVSYGPSSGSDVLLVRRSEALEAIGIQEMVVGFKVHSSRCAIVRLVGHIDSRVVGNCPYYEVYADELRQELGSDWKVPSLCAP